MNWSIEITPTDWRCYVCKKTYPKGGLAIVYYRESIILRWVCIYHKLCKVFVHSGVFCSNHEDGQDVECNTIPF